MPYVCSVLHGSMIIEDSSLSSIQVQVQVRLPSSSSLQVQSQKNQKSKWQSRVHVKDSKIACKNISLRDSEMAKIPKIKKIKNKNKNLQIKTN